MIRKQRTSLISGIAISLFFGISVSVVHASNQGWTAKKNQSGIQIYQRLTESGYPETRGTLKIFSNLESLTAVMSDRSNCSAWVFACRFGEMIKQTTSDGRIDYTVVDSPLWFADRDMYIHTHSTFTPETRTLVLRLSGREHYDKKQVGRVRVTNLYGSWIIKEVNTKELFVSYSIHTNPRLVPSPLFDAYMAESVLHTLNGLKLLTEKQYESKHRN